MPEWDEVSLCDLKANQMKTVAQLNCTHRVTRNEIEKTATSYCTMPVTFGFSVYSRFPDRDRDWEWKCESVRAYERVRKMDTDLIYI